MRKPHWETVRQTPMFEKILKPFSEKIVIEDSNGPISDSVVFRRAFAAKKFVPGMNENDFKQAINSGFQSYEFTGHSAPDGIPFQDWVNSTAIGNLIAFCKHGERIYKIARDFGEQLAKVDLNLSGSLVPKTVYPICIEFPESLRFQDNEDFFHCAYVSVESFPPNTWFNASKKSVSKVIDILLPCYKEDQTSQDVENNLVLTFERDDEPLTAAIERAIAHSTHPVGNTDVIRYILKCLVYLNSGDPDLRGYRAPTPPKTENSKKLRRWVKEHANHSMVDMTLVGFDFKKPKVYQVGETLVTGHFRWQPYGPRREAVKLIWIEPFVRHYTKEEQEQMENERPKV